MLHLGALRRVTPALRRRLLPRHRRAAAFWGGHDLVVARRLFIVARRRLVDAYFTDDAHVVSIFVVDEDEADAEEEADAEMKKPRAEKALGEKKKTSPFSALEAGLAMMNPDPEKMREQKQQQQKEAAAARRAEKAAAKKIEKAAAEPKKPKPRAKRKGAS